MKSVAASGILITGAAGLVGGAVIRRLASDGHPVVATDARTTKLPDGVLFETIDLSDRPAVDALLQQHAIDTVIHCGAISGPMVAADDPHRVMATNVGGTLNLAEAARKAHVRRFIALSSVAVYGAQTSLDAVTEAAPLNATDVYGASKIAMEAVLRAYRYELGLPAFVLRLASVYGPGRQTDCFIRDLIRSAANGTEINLPTEDKFRRQFVHIDDVVHAIVLATTTSAVDEFAYNVGGGEWLTEREVAGLAALTLPHLRISTVPAPARCIDGYMGVLDYSRATAAFSYRPAVDIRHGIASYAGHLAAEAR